jgi:hypothetical protein
MTNTQLSLFSTPPAVETTYKVGDFVKLRRKSVHAAYFKKGDILQIEAIHPRDGICKFWNDRTESWGYVYPDEFTLVPPPVDSVTSIVEPVVTESNSPVDSVTSIVEPVVTESNPPVDSVTKSASAISTYRPRGTARSGEYFRFSYRDGGKVRHIHIKGGNTDSPISQAKVEEVRSLLAAGAPPVQIAFALSQHKL